MRDILTYPAVFSFDPDGISIEFPDFKGCISGSKTASNAVTMARDALSLRLWSDECDNIPFPEPSDPVKLKATIEPSQVIVLVDVDMDSVRAHHNRKNANVMVTVPQGLVYDARKAGLNFSQLMQNALIKELGKSYPIRHRKSR